MPTQGPPRCPRSRDDADTEFRLIAGGAGAYPDARNRARDGAGGGVGGASAGRGMEEASDQAAVDAMRRELNNLPIDGTVVIGEGEIDEAPMLFIGEKVGNTRGPQVDIAVDPLEGNVLCAKNMPGAIATIAMARAGTLLHAPDCYMDKIAIGPGYPIGTVDLDAPVEENIINLAKAKGVKPTEITAILLDRPRHAAKIAALRKLGAAVSLIARRQRRRRRHPHRRAANGNRHLSR